VNIVASFIASLCPSLRRNVDNSVEYLKYGFSQSPANQLLPMCMICQKVFSNAMKPSMLQEHLTKLHPDKKDKNVSYFQVVEEKYFKRPTISQLFESSTKQDNDETRFLYFIVDCKSGKTHTQNLCLVKCSKRCSLKQTV
jgi:hypothetical protein